MKKKFLFIISTIVLVFCFSSCKPDEEKRVEFTQIVEARSTEDLLNDLYLASDGDVESIARIFNCTPSSIERIRKGETKATSKFSEIVNDVMVYYYMYDSKFMKLRSKFDPSWKWYDSVRYFYIFLPGGWLIIVGIIVGILIGVLGLPIWLIGFIISLCCSPSQMEDRYKDVINPVVEEVVSYK